MIEYVVPVAVLAGGIAAGGLLISALGGAELLVWLPVDSYIPVHQFLATRFDPLMPICLLLALGCDAALVVGAGEGARAALAAAGAVLYVVVITVSLTRNVPINKWVSTLRPDALPDVAVIDERRESWRAWNLVRTCLATAAFLLNVVLVGILL